MRLTFRGKLMWIVGIATIAFMSVIVSGTLIRNRLAKQLGDIENRYLPKLELQPQLENQMERLQHAFQDAVASHDFDGLKETGELKGHFLASLEAAHGAVNASDATALRAAMQDYYASAYDVSRRLMANETGEALGDAVTSMQAKRTHVQEQIVKVAALDRHELANAFSAATQAAAAARRYELWIGITSLFGVLALSFWLTHGVVRAVGELTLGFRRFGKGDFSRRIVVVGHDELEVVARQANEMALNLERLARERARAETALLTSNRELDAFSYSVAHDLRAPLRGINGFSRALQEDYGDRLDGEAKDYLNRIAAAALRMGELIDALLALARVTRTELKRQSIDMSCLAEECIKQLRSSHPERELEFVNEAGLTVSADLPLMRAVLENLLGNAWKFTGGRAVSKIAFGAEDKNGVHAFFIRDNGAGFDMAHASKLFAPFQRLHTTTEFAGTGIGLATVQRILHRHGGRVWAEGRVGEGATFYFSVPNPEAEGAMS